MSDDIKNFREAVQKFDELIIELERVDEKMSANFKNYHSLNTNFDEVIEEQKLLTDNINNIQKESFSTIDIMKSIYTNIGLSYTNNLSNLKTELEKFNNAISNTINKAIDNIDISNVSNKIEQLLDDKIKTLELENTRLKNLNNKLDEQIKNNAKKVSTIITQTNTKIDDNIERFNKMSKVVNWGILASSAAGGLAVGILITLFILSSHLTR